MKWKRWASLVLCLALAAGLFVPARAADGAVLTLTQPASLPAAGQSFEVTVSISGNPGLCAAQLTLRYNAAVVRCTSAGAGAALSGMLSAGNEAASGGAIVAAAGTTPGKRDGVLASFRFVVLKSGDPGFSLADVSLTDEAGAEIVWSLAAGTPGVLPGAGGAAAALFTDVPSGYWAHDAIARAVSLGLIAGYADGTFRPGDPVTRAQFTLMLYRLAGEPAVTAAAKFPDVPATSRFAAAIAWASQNGYVNGRADGRFDPSGAVTREQAVAILFRYSGGVSGMETLFSAVYQSKFEDSGAVASYARAAFDWAIYNGVVSGTSETTLSPKKPASRAQIAAILLNFVDAIS